MPKVSDKHPTYPEYWLVPEVIAIDHVRFCLNPICSLFDLAVPHGTSHMLLAEMSPSYQEKLWKGAISGVPPGAVAKSRTILRKPLYLTTPWGTIVRVYFCEICAAAILEAGEVDPEFWQNDDWKKHLTKSGL